MLLLVPADVLRPRRPDDHFRAEFEAARAAGHEVGLIDHDAATPTTTPKSDDAVYRGWMLTAERYASLAEDLRSRDVTLRTTPEQYRANHELPGWYDLIRPVTPETVWTEGEDGFTEACARLGSGPAVLRDYTKSMKHYWDEAAFIPDVADTAAAVRVAARFRELRGDDFTGGYVLRRFEEFTGAEVRTWWVGGECRLITAHPDTPDALPPDDVDLPPQLASITSFVSADLVRHADGRWRVVEVGDGQVSDRPSSAAPEALLGVIDPGNVPTGAG
jgi:hypothetical protein